jgi:hypothetical protein
MLQMEEKALMAVICEQEVHLEVLEELDFEFEMVVRVELSFDDSKNQELINKINNNINP